MKLSEINLNSETLSGFFKKRWMIILSFVAGFAIIGAFAWSFLFLLQAVNKSVHYDELRVSGETKGIDMDSYNRLALNANSANTNGANENANAANTNSSNENANMAANTNGNVNTALNNNTSDMNTNQ